MSATIASYSLQGLHIANYASQVEDCVIIINRQINMCAYGNKYVLHHIVQNLMLGVVPSVVYSLLGVHVLSFCVVIILKYLGLLIYWGKYEE